MNALDDDDRDRLVKLLGLLGSDHAGERDAAANAASRFLRARKLMWRDVIAPPPSLPPPRLYAERLDWRGVARACAMRDCELSDWESGFVRNVIGLAHPSPKQEIVLLRIARRLGLLAGEAAA